MSRIGSPKKKDSFAEVVVLKRNQNKKGYLQNQFVKESFVGEEAVQKFYDRYRKVERAKDIEKFMKEDNAITRIVDLLQHHNFAPRKLDLIKLKGSEAALDLRQLGLGQGSLGPVISELIEYVGDFESVDLSNNRIDRLLSESLIESLSHVQIINLSHNRIGKVGCAKFAELFLSQKT